MAASAAELEGLSLSTVILDLAAIYLTALLGGELARRLGFPALLGTLLGGLTIGISGLQLVTLPQLGSDATESVVLRWSAWLHQTSDPALLEQVFRFQGAFLQELANVGVLVLLFEVGLGANLNRVLAQRSQVIAVAGTGVFLSLLGCSLTLNAFWNVPLLTALFVGAALTVTSLGVTRQLLQQNGYLRSTENQIIVGAAVLDDVTGILLLSLVLGIQQEGTLTSLTILRLIVGTMLGLAIATFLGRWVSPLLVQLEQALTTRGRVITPALMFTLLLVLLASVAQLSPILGAFTAGLVLQGKIRRLIREVLSPVVDACVPIFFVYIGTITDLSLLLPWQNAQAWPRLSLLAFLILAAFAVKFASGYALSRHEGINPALVGWGMVPRGEVGLVFAELGLRNDLLDPVLFASLVVLSVVLILATSWGLRWVKPLSAKLP